MDNLISMALKLIYRKARCMDRAPVLGDEVSIRVEELLIIGALEAIFVDADGIQFPQLEPYALWLTRKIPPGVHVEELDGPAFCVFPSPHTYPRG